MVNSSQRIISNEYIRTDTTSGSLRGTNPKKETTTAPQKKAIAG